RLFSSLKLSLMAALLVSAGAQAATTTLTVNATGSLGVTISFSGTASLTNIGSGGSTVSGTIAATVSLTPDPQTGNLSVPFTITFPSATGGPGTILGTVGVPASALTG